MAFQTSHYAYQITEVGNIGKVAAELPIDSSDLTAITDEQKNLVAVIILVLAEVPRIAAQLEADRKVTISRNGRLLRELYEDLLFMAGKVTVSSRIYYVTAFDGEIPESNTLPVI